VGRIISLDVEADQAGAGEGAQGKADLLLVPKWRSVSKVKNFEKG
jgi:hypothetical protein